MKRMRSRHLVVLFVFIVASDLRAAQLSEAKADSGTVTSDGFQLRYIAEGTGHPALVIGGALLQSRIFSDNLRRHLRLVFADHRGFAPSPGHRDTSAFSLDSLTGDMERVRQELNLGRIVVIGHSGHALMALEYAKKYRSNVSHVVMVGIAPNLSEASAKAAEQHWKERASAERKAIMAENLRRLPDEELAKLPISPGQRFVRWYVRSAPKIWYDARFDASALWEGVELNMDMVDHVWGRIFRDYDMSVGLPSFDCPVFLALGRYDFLVAPLSSWKPMRPLFKDLTVRVFERSGHSPQYEEPAEFDTELIRWINGRRGG
jgi:proline iminopeptidase